MTDFVDTPSLPVGVADAALAAGILVKKTTTGYAAAGVTDDPVGVTIRAYASGEVCQPRALTAGSCSAIASGAITVGATVYGAAAGAISATPGGFPLGVCAAAAGSGEFCLFIPAIQSHFAADRAQAAVAASADVENTTDETAFNKTVVIAAGSLVAGSTIRIRGVVKVTDNNSTDTLTLKLKLGSTVLCTTAAVDVADDDVGLVDALVTIRTAGSSGTLVSSAMHTLGVPGTATMKSYLLTSTAIDTTAAQTVSMTATWSVAHADDECNLEQLVVEVL